MLLSWCLTSGGENRGELVRRYDLQLIERASARRLVAAPATELSSMSKPVALHMIVRNFDDQLRTDRLPRQVLSLAPTTLSARHPMRLTIRLGMRLCPPAPWMSVERVLTIGSKKSHQLLPLGIGESGADTDVLEVAAAGVKAGQ